MSKYSSDSDYDRRSTKRSQKSRRRSTSSDSSDSRTKRKREKKSEHYSRNYDSRSKSQRSKSPLHLHKSSRRYRDRKHSESSDRHRSTERKYNHKSRRSRSRSYIQEYVSKSKRRSSTSSDSSSSTSNSSLKKNPSTYQTKETKSTTQCSAGDTHAEGQPINSKVISEINDDNFVQKKFSSNAKKVPDNIVIDLTKQTIKVPEVEQVEPDTIYHHNLFLNEEARMEKWIKELFTYRQKALQQGIKH